MGFINWARQHAKLDILTDGRTASGTRIIGIAFVAKVKSPFFFGYVPNSTDPNNMNLLNSTDISYNGGDLRGTLDITSFAIAATPVRANFLIGAVRTIKWSVTTAFLSQKNIQYIFRKPEDIIHIAFYTSGSGSGNHIAGAFAIPNFPNLKTIYILNGDLTAAVLAGYASITSITGNWPEKLEAFHFQSVNPGNYLTSIQRKFPKSLKHFVFGQTNSTIVSSLEALLADCTNLISLLFTNETWAEGGALTNGSTPLTGSFNISQIVANSLQYFSIANATGLTNLVYTSGAFSSIKRINFYSCTAMNSATLGNIFNEVLNSPNGEFIQFRLNNSTFTRAMVDADFKSTLTNFIIYGNKITGNITLNTAKPALIEFRIGDTSTNLADAAKSNFGIVDLRGLTNATVIDASNGLITDLQLPVNTVITELDLGGNRLSKTTNANIISQIAAMTALISLRLSTGSSSSTDGQGTSADGLGSNVNLSALAALTTLWIAGCKLTGTLTLAPSIATLVCNSNASLAAIVSSSGTFPNCTLLFVTNCTSLNLDFTKFPALTNYALSAIGSTVVDISNRSSTAQISQIVTNGSATVTTVTLPSNAVNAVMSINSSIDLRSCPLLTAVNNLDKISYASLSTGSSRILNASGCALNIDFKVGINSFLPATVTINNNAMSQANVDLNIDNIYQNRSKWATTVIAKSLNISGTNSTPTGTYAAPPGFVLGSADGTPTTGKQKLYVLANNYGWTVTYTP